MKKVISIFLLFIGCSFLFNANANEVDSLRLLVDRLPQNDTTRLAHLRKIAIIQQSTHPGLLVAQELYKEANRLNSDKYKCYSAFYMALYYTNNGILDSVNTYASEAIRLAEKEEMWKTYFEAAKVKVNTLIMNEEYEYAIDEASKMYNKANELNNTDGKITASICLATTYIASDRINESIETLKAAYKDKAKIKNIFVLTEILSLLSSTAHYVDNYDDLYIYLNDLNKAIHDYLKNNPFSESYNSIFLFIDIHYAYYYVAKGKPEEALKHLEKAQKLRNHYSFSIYSNIFYDAYSEYYFYTKQYDKALAAIDSSIVDLQTLMPKDYYKQLIKKAVILSNAGKHTEALELYQESMHGKDSIDHILSSKQMEQIQNIYKVNKLLLEKEQIKSNRSFIALIVILLFTTLLALFIIRALFVRKKLKESENEMRIATQMAEEANEVKNLFLSNMSYNIRTPLNSVVGFSQLMAIDPDMDEAQRKEYSTIIKQNSEVLLNLVNDVLDISRLEAGMMKFNLQEYEVITLCREAIYTAKAKEQPIQINFQPEFEEQQIRVDTFRFSQVLVSLLTYPTPVNRRTTITLTVRLDKANQCVYFKTVGSPIANPEAATQEVTIRNDINLLFLKRFGGTYEVYTETLEGPAIVFTYPLSISE
ncbi:HAMP domain-containing sensor histidine kinase [Bacteroides sp. 51]|uniref:ATP-binding protein n=1 Tax=Bacteroides sp. 51 TaxID=2302938 RepID=UPI0013D6973E|nr:HAMP domain-containing sensor histidine kinase [Bacteroides sp. 51]